MDARTPREERGLEDVYGESEFEPPSTLKRHQQHLVKVENDWSQRQSLVTVPPLCVLWERSSGFGKVPGFATKPSISHEHQISGRRGRGRPRKYPLPAIEHFVHPLTDLNMHPGIPLPPNRILSGKLASKMIEYDADEQDIRWLQAVYNVRHLEISVDVFEQIIHVLEHEWFELTRGIQKRQAMITAANTSFVPHEVTVCEICQSSNHPPNNSNVLVWCDGCDLAVHQECYGIPHIPEGPWMCRACSQDTEFSHPASCCLCPWPGGALKPTTDGRWAHLVCGRWVPGASILNPGLREPIDCSQVDQERFSLVCYLCLQSFGAPIQCHHPKCHLSFHPFCAMRAGLTMKPDQPDSSRERAKLLQLALCAKHGPVDMNLRMSKSFWAASADQDESDIDIESDYCFPINDHRSTEPGNPEALVHIYPLTIRRPPAPRLPSILPTCVIQSVSSEVQQDEALVSLVARYWTLKRTDRHNYPLIKHLSFEPWTCKTTKDSIATLGYLVNDMHRILEMAVIKAEIARQQLIVSRCIERAVSILLGHDRLDLLHILQLSRAAPPLRERHIDGCVDDFVWVALDGGRRAIAAKVQETSVDHSISKDVLVRLFDQERSWIHCQPKDIYILSNDYDGDVKRYCNALLDRSSHSQAVREREKNCDNKKKKI